MDYNTIKEGLDKGYQLVQLRAEDAGKFNEVEMNAEHGKALEKLLADGDAWIVKDFGAPDPRAKTGIAEFLLTLNGTDYQVWASTKFDGIEAFAEPDEGADEAIDALNDVD